MILHRDMMFNNVSVGGHHCINKQYLKGIFKGTKSETERIKYTQWFYNLVKFKFHSLRTRIKRRTFHQLMCVFNSFILIISSYKSYYVLVKHNLLFKYHIFIFIYLYNKPSKENLSHFKSDSVCLGYSAKETGVELK